MGDNILFGYHEVEEMNRTKIEWTDFTWNPITGCLNSCPYCYARKIAKRFPNIFPNGFKPTFHEDRLAEPYEEVPETFRSKNPNLSLGHAMIFTVSMGEMFGSWVPDTWISKILEVIRDNPWHVFQILTKCPENTIEWNFPDKY